MPSFSQFSLRHLATVHPDIQLVMHEVIRGRDIRVISGLRTAEEQAGIYAKGRTVPGKIVTWADGVRVRSHHQALPGEDFGRAVDVVPYPVDWGDREQFFLLAGYIERVAEEMGIPLEWGGHWPGGKQDLPHWQLPRR